MKRFIETLRWAKPWFRRLTPKQKLLWQWLCDNCDGAGVIDPDWDLASLQIGEDVSLDDTSVFEDRVTVLAGGKLWLATFIEFQYGRLSRDCKPHAPIFASLEKHGINLDSENNGQRVSERVSQRVCNTLQAQERVKEKEKDMEKEGGAGGIPPVTMESVKTNCGQFQATPEIAERWWLDQDQRGWLDVRGQPIVRWQSSLTSYAISWRANENKRGGPSKSFQQQDLDQRRKDRAGPEQLNLKVL